MNAPAKFNWSEGRFGPDTAHWLPRNPDAALDHIPGEDGMPVAEICRKAGISAATYFKWKKKYDGLQSP